MSWEPVVYKYSTSLKWTGEHGGVLSCEGKPEVEVACPPEWGGHAGIWSPEDLFVASLETCTLTTFIFLLEKHRGRMLSYESSAESRAQMVDGVFVFKEAVVRPRVVVPTEEDARRARQAFEETPAWCLVTKSIKCPVRIEPSITVGPPAHQ